MSNTDNSKTDTPTSDNGKGGYKLPPVKNRFPKGKSGNPFGRPKGQRNMFNVLIDVLRQTVTVKQGDKSERLTKGEAVIKVIMNQANNGDPRAIGAVSYLAEKIGRLEDANSETSPRAGAMFVPGVAKSHEEYKAALANERIRKDLMEKRQRAEAPGLERKEALLRSIIADQLGTPAAVSAAAQSGITVSTVGPCCFVALRSSWNGVSQAPGLVTRAGLFLRG
jgi:hypothetical protein